MGVYADPARARDCVIAPAGGTIEPVVWAWIPDDVGLAYVTIRFVFPDNIELLGRPVLNDLISDIIITEFPDGTSEWNMVFVDCPSGWVNVMTIPCRVRDDKPSRVEVVAARSMARDCTNFVLNGVGVASELAINEPGCGAVEIENRSWAAAKWIYR